MLTEDQLPNNCKGNWQGSVVINNYRHRQPSANPVLIYFYSTHLPNHKSNILYTIIPHYPSLFEQVIEEIKICDIPFDLTSLSQFFRIIHFDFMSLNYKGFIELLNRMKVEDQEFNFQLNEIKKIIENELIKLFFKKLSSLSE